MSTTSSKLFASGYAMFSGVVFLSSIGLVLAPLFHRILHKFHLDDAEQDERKKTKRPNPPLQPPTAPSRRG
ncbi:MAG: hypothetical protein ABIO94_03035 [Opitutaceae bacterium]